MGPWLRFAIAGVAAFTVTSTVQVPAGEPKLEELLARVPILSSDGGTAASFRLRGRVQLRPKLFFDFEAAWAKPDRGAMLVTIGEDDPVPVLYCAQKKILLVDYFQNVVTYQEKGTPSIKVGLGDDDKLLLGFGVNSGDAGKIVVDLPPLLRGLGNKAEWTRQEGGAWRYSNVSKSGNSRLIADFDAAARGNPLQRLELRSASDDSLTFAFYDMVVDEPVPSRLTSFPARSDFPDGIIVESKQFEADQNAAGFAWIMKQFMSGVLATAAIDNPDLREAVEAFAEVDWKQAEQNRRRYASQFRNLLSPDAVKQRN